MTASFLLYLLKVSVCLCLFYSFYYFALRKENYFQWNRAYLLGTVFFSLLLPHFELNLASTIDPLFYIGFEEIIQDSFPEEKINVFSIEKGLLTIYLIGVLVLTLKLVLSLGYILHLRYSSHVQQNEGYSLIKINKPHTVFSFFNMIFWSNDLEYSDDEADQILRHELVHIRQKHSLDILYLTFVNILLWFNPIAYWYRKSMKNTHEFIADFDLYQIQNFQLSYVDLLMKEAKVQRRHSLPTVHMFLNDQLINRLKMINNYNKKSNKTKLLASIPLALLLVFFFSCKQNTYPSHYENDAISSPKSGSIFQACTIDKNGMITLKDGSMVTVDEMKDIIVERRKAEGDFVSKDQVFIISKEAMKNSVTYPDNDTISNNKNK